MKTVVLIEDNAEIKDNIAEILELADYKVFTAENGKAGVEVVKKEKPDLVICDIMMPELDGYGVLHILSKSPETASIPFIFLTAKAEKSDMRKGMNLGADDYITKPFDETELLDAIEVRLNRSEKIKKEYGKGADGLNAFLDEVSEIKELSDLSKDRKLKAYKKKEDIYRQGDYANYLYFITKGKIKSVKSDEYAKELVTDLHKEGDFFGYMALLEGDEHRETATAMEEVEVAVIPKQDFLSLIQKNRDVSTKFIKMLADNVMEKEEQLLQLAYSPVRERVAAALLRLSGEGGESAIKMSREDLAAVVGTATETLIRTLSEFKDEGIIESEGRSIRVADAKKLKRASGSF